MTGELQEWRPVLNGVLAPPSPLMPMQSNPHPSDVAKDSWHRAEAATGHVIKSIQPTAVSERRRKDVIEYMQNLIKRSIGSEVFPFGSVPLKTYLPDGDIDLTALGIPNSDDTLASDVRTVLEMEEQNMHSEFEVKDVQYINAEVKLVKCLVQNIVVDLSFDQIGGLSTLCFLEQIDQLIGKDHIFKRSIILIKAWCYYESRILGAHHGLISTYALETLVLYIFHLFHSSLDGPLSVLYRFLDYYSKFDWDNYCVSLHGPISLSSLPELVADSPLNEGGDLLLTKEYLKNCAEVFSVPPKGFERNPRVFPHKHLNIVDPLKVNNNLGRSVSRANFYRIRSAFTYGARKLGQILLLPSNRIANEVKLFFTNTLDRHGSGDRPDVQDALPNCRRIVPNNCNSVDSAPSDLKATDRDGVSEHLKEIKHEMKPMKRSGLEENNKCLAGDGISRSSLCIRPREESKSYLPANEKSKQQSGKYFYAPLVHTDDRHLEGGLVQSAAEYLADLSVSSTRFVQPDSSESESPTCSTSWLSTHGSVSPSWNANLSLVGVMNNGGNGSPDLNKLPDLSGDAELHRRSLYYAQFNQEYMSGTYLLPGMHHSSSYQYPNKHSWDPTWQQRGVYTNMNANGVSHEPPFPPASYQPFIPAAYGIDDLRKPRGTGTYFPNTNYHSNYKERHSPGRGKVPAFASNLSKQRSSGRADTSRDAHYQEKISLEPPMQLQLPVINANNHGKMAVVDLAHSVRPVWKETNAIGPVFPLEGSLAFGSFRPFPPLVGAPSTELGKRSDSVSIQAPGSAQANPASTVPKPSDGTNHERSIKGYQLKDEGDFPPLTG